jgi:hypothetical protein
MIPDYSVAETCGGHVPDELFVLWTHQLGSCRATARCTVAFETIFQNRKADNKR